MKRLPARLKSTLLWLLALVTVVFVLRQLDVSMLAAYLKGADKSYLALALVALNLAQWFSAFRMRYYLSCSGALLENQFAIRLYYLGMFYNLLLPGGIGGDGYKVWILAKRHLIHAKRAIGRLIEDRASGLFALCLLTLLLAKIGTAYTLLPYADGLLVLAALACVAGYFLLAKLLFNASVSRSLRGVYYSVGVQACNLLCAWAILTGIHSGNIADYLLLFCVSSILGVLPLSVGGLGVRELVYWAGAPLLHISPEKGVAASLTYFTMYALTALPGAAFIPTLRPTATPSVSP